MALANNGKSRKARKKTGTGLGKLSDFTSTLPYLVSTDRLEELEKQKQKLHPDSRSHGRHNQICPPPYHTKITKSLKCKKNRCKKKHKKNNECNDENDGSTLSSTAKPTNNKKKPIEDANSPSVKKPKSKKSQMKHSSLSSSEHVIKTAVTSIEDGDDRETTTIILDDDHKEFLKSDD